MSRSLMSEAWQGLNKMGMHGRVAAGAAIMIKLNEDTVKQMALLVNWAVDPRLEIRQRHWGEEGILPWKLKILI